MGRHGITWMDVTDSPPTTAPRLLQHPRSGCHLAGNLLIPCRDIRGITGHGLRIHAQGWQEMLSCPPAVADRPNGFQLSSIWQTGSRDPPRQQLMAEYLVPSPRGNLQGFACTHRPEIPRREESHLRLRHLQPFEGSDRSRGILYQDPIPLIRPQRRQVTQVRTQPSGSRRRRKRTGCSRQGDIMFGIEDMNYHSTKIQRKNRTSHRKCKKTKNKKFL